MGIKAVDGIGLADVQAVYSGPEGDLWELLMGEQIHIGGMTSSLDLADRAGIVAGMRGVDLCCCSGAGMRFLVRFRGVAAMTGVDATAKVVERGRMRNQIQGLADCIDFVLGDACTTGLPDARADFVWGEDAWCYVVDKPVLVAEAVRLVRPGGVVAFTDWVDGPTGLEADEAEHLLRFMKFPNIQSLPGYVTLLKTAGLEVEDAHDTGRFAPCVELYRNMVGTQLTYDALRTIGFDQDLLAAIGTDMAFMQELANQGRIIQALFVARKPA